MTHNEYKQVCKLIRQGKATAEQKEQAAAHMNSIPMPSVIRRTIFDLDCAADMWASDARDIGA